MFSKSCLGNKILTIDVPLILIVSCGRFFYAGKTHNRRFQGVYREGEDFFDPHIVLCAAKDDLGVRFIFRDGHGWGFNPRQSNITWKMKVRLFSILRILNRPWAIQNSKLLTKLNHPHNPKPRTSRNRYLRKMGMNLLKVLSSEMGQAKSGLNW